MGIAKIYSAWGDNATLMASDIGEEGVTVRQWRNRGFIRPRYWPKIIERAAARGVTLTSADFPDDHDSAAVAVLATREAA